MSLRKLRSQLYPVRIIRRDFQRLFQSPISLFATGELFCARQLTQHLDTDA
jgi:hypothetical protein